MFPEEPPAPQLIATAPEPEPANWTPLVLGGGALIVGAVGLGFGLSSRAAAKEQALEGNIRLDRDYEPLADRQKTHGLIANVAFVTAGIAVGFAVLSLVSGWP